MNQNSKKINIKRVSIILPTYNEAENIILLIKEIDRTVKYPKQVIVVDDNSPDGTARLVQEYIKQSKKPYIQLELRTKDRGLRKSIALGIKKSLGDVIVWMDCDFSHPPDLINNLLEKIRQGNDIAVASRFIKNGGFVVPEGNSPDSWVAILLSRVMNYTIQLLLDKRFKDYTSGFIASRKEIFKKIKLRGDYGEYFIDLIYRAISLGFKIVEIPYIQNTRRAGESKTGQNLWQYSKRGIKYIYLTCQLLLEKQILKKIP